MAGEQNQNGLRGLKNFTKEVRTQWLLGRITNKHIFNFENTQVTSYDPRVESPDFNYANAYDVAIKRNQEIFGVVPSTLEILRFTTTEDFNKYLHIRKPGWSKKVKGDWWQGVALENNKIALIDYSGLLTESSLQEDHGHEPDFQRFNCQQILTHELAHITTNLLVGKYSANVPHWLGEGIAILTATQKNRKKDPKEPSLKDFLNTLQGRVPTNKELEQKGGGKKPRTYGYAIEFMKWVFLNKTVDEIALSEKDIPEENKYDEQRIHLFVDVLRNIGTGTSFEESFNNVFGLPYEDAYRQFYGNLT